MGSGRSIGLAVLGVAAVFTAAFHLGAAAQTATRPSTRPASAPGSAGLSIRIGIATDLEQVDIPCCTRGAQVVLGGERLAQSTAVRVTPGSAGNGAYRLQAAALKDEEQAAQMAARLQKNTGQPGSSFFDAGTGLYQVRVGRFKTREQADSFKERYSSQGLRQAWTVSEGGLVGEAALQVSASGKARRVAGRWVSVTAPEDQPIRIAQGRFRGSILVYLNDRGLLNLVNEVPLEQYLRGVVPLEMGPEVYGELASLRAQTIAARTYAVRNLGQFEGEGYDLCATVRCQVYGGAGAEHPVSDRAIVETAGQVLVHEGSLADALYSATCGGSTEDVHVVFPSIRASYLSAVPCIEGPLTSVATSVSVGSSFWRGVMVVAQDGAQAVTDAAVMEHRLRDLAKRARLAVPRDALKSLRRDEVGLVEEQGVAPLATDVGHGRVQVEHPRTAGRGDVARRLLLARQLLEHLRLELLLHEEASVELGHAPPRTCRAGRAPDRPPPAPPGRARGPRWRGRSGSPGRCRGRGPARSRCSSPRRRSAGRACGRVP